MAILQNLLGYRFVDVLCLLLQAATGFHLFQYGIKINWQTLETCSSCVIHLRKLQDCIHACYINWLIQHNSLMEINMYQWLPGVIDKLHPNFAKWLAVILYKVI